MQCKACGASVSNRVKKHFSDDVIAEVEEREDLCSVCLSKAHKAFDDGLTEETYVDIMLDIGDINVQH